MHPQLALRDKTYGSMSEYAPI